MTKSKPLLALKWLIDTNQIKLKTVEWVKTLTEYYFKIEYIKGSNNIRVDALSQKLKL